MPLEVRFAHPVRLSPDTHSQGHGRPCPQRHHPRRGFSATWTFHDVFSGGIPDCSFQMNSPDELSRWPFHDTCFRVLNF